MANLYTENNRFSMLPTAAEGEASKFIRDFTKNTTMNSGKLYPILVDEVLPGDHISMDFSIVARMATPLVPVFDDCFIDVMFFNVPNRITWDSWKQFFGESNPSAWDEDVDLEIPHAIYTFKSNGVGDNFGIPTKVPVDVNVLPFRAYNLIWNEWFRDQNLQDALYVNTTNANSVGTSNFDDLLPVNKVHDFFTSALPSPQKGPSVLLGLGAYAPVITTSTLRNTSSAERMVFDTYDYSGLNNASNWNGSHANFVTTSYLNEDNTVGGVYAVSTSQSGPDSAGAQLYYVPKNLVADLSQSGATDINSLRNAITIQQFLEKDARGGSRYREYIYNHFGVSIPDSTVQVPEYLGGKRIPITMNQVVQTSSSVLGDFPQALGDTGAYSKTIDSGHYFDFTATEHGYLIGVACIRYKHSYEQGLNRLWSRRDRFEFYDPIYANIGEQPVYNRQIFVQPDNVESTSNINDQVFGYQEAWAEYRYRPNEICGDFRSNSSNGSLNFWHYGDYYTSLPYLSDAWIRENPDNIDRTLAVSSRDENGEEITNQFLVSMYFRPIWIRQMPVYSVPGLDTI